MGQAGRSVEVEVIEDRVERIAKYTVEPFLEGGRCPACEVGCPMGVRGVGSHEV
jgi:hypothetical protein